MRVAVAGAGRIGHVHVATLDRLDSVEEILIADADPDRARALADTVGATALPTTADLFTAGADALVVAAATDAHAELIVAGVEAGLPTFCEKPVAMDSASTRAVAAKIDRSDVPVQIGFQRRYDAGYRAARAAVADAALGWLHTVRAGTLDAAPPPAAYVPGSGGLFRDCSVHDFDAIRWVTGQEVADVYAVGANHGADFFSAAGDVDAAAALLTLSDGTFAHVMAGRYNAAGYDVRMELLGSADSVAVGLDEKVPLRSMEPGAVFPAGPAWVSFLERFQDAYVAELSDFVRTAAEGGPAACTVADALEAILIADACELSRRERRPVAMSEVR